eukprot:TRINITY_DN4962_c0_g3_i1.p1 TRINITY_DN4962_c0_g3~~TRINITY_DN4962_c0_g3_i1.p1  ORF type:complete len:242 (+),score=-21.87 TRINITY_DN4962_c0_g3_i1:681-1406(+)
MQKLPILNIQKSQQTSFVHQNLTKKMKVSGSFSPNKNLRAFLCMINIIQVNSGACLLKFFNNQFMPCKHYFSSHLFNLQRTFYLLIISCDAQIQNFYFNFVMLKNAPNLSLGKYAQQLSCIFQKFSSILQSNSKNLEQATKNIKFFQQYYTIVFSLKQKSKNGSMQKNGTIGVHFLLLFLIPNMGQNNCCLIKKYDKLKFQKLFICSSMIRYFLKASTQFSPRKFLFPTLSYPNRNFCSDY